MPFDALVQSSRSLVDVAHALGLNPIPPEVLEEHKRTELAKAPPESFLYKYRTLAQLTVIISGAIGFVVGGFSVVSVIRNLVRSPISDAEVAANLLAAVVLLIVAALLLTFVTRMATRWLYGPAKWVETDPGRWLLDVPMPIANNAIKLMFAMPDACIVVGELRQEQTVLDPYLLVRTGTDEVCLGIWKGDTILYHA